MNVTLASEPDFSRCRPVRLPDGTWSPIKDHVKIGVRALLANPYFFITDEMGGMKSAQCIIAAQFLFEQGVIQRAIVVAPASVFRDVWYDEELGELQKHLFIPATIELYHGKSRSWEYGDGGPRMHWIVANYEFIRREERLAGLLPYCDEKTLLIVDESSAVRNYRAAQTKAVMELRWKNFPKEIPRCGRVVELNGTPIATSPLDLFAQGNLLHPDILDCRNITKFRARYAEMGGYVVHTAWGSRPTQIIGWKHLDDLQNRFAPYVLRRLKKDCLDLPEVLPEVTLTATLTPATWKIYTQMRDEMVSWLSESTVSVAALAITKIIRLSQITSGFIGGLEPEIFEDLNDGRPDWLQSMLPMSTDTVREVGREKLDVLLEFLDTLLENDPNLKFLTWCHYIPELDRLLREWKTRYPGVEIGCVAGRPLLGGKNKKVEREAALRLLNPQTAPLGPAFVGGTYGTGSLGLNFTACHTVVNMSYDASYWKYEQGAARVDRPGQVHPVSTFNIVAVGPKGQKTIDHRFVAARLNREEVANWTTSKWIQALQEE